MAKLTRDKQKSIWLNEIEIEVLNEVLSASGDLPYSQWMRTHLKQDADKLGINIRAKKEKLNSQ